MDINWWNIKSFNNSQNNAFEELVCQLARNENIPNRKSFFRLGTPDGGVEAYCVLENGEEYGWQAKYFNTMGKSQWNQLEKSFHTALDKHPNLSKYYICIPLDRSDPRKLKQSWFMDKWNSFLKNSKEYANSKRKSIDIEYWGSSELIERLSLNVNIGKLRFWFNQEEFTDEWFNGVCKDSIDALGHRYTPKLNFELDIAKIFDGISHNEKFKKLFKELVHKHLLIIEKCSRFLNDLALKIEQKKMISCANEIKELFYNTSFSPAKKIEYILFQRLIEKTQELISEIENKIHQLTELESEVTDKKDKKIKTKHTNRFFYQLNLLRHLYNSTYEFINFIDSPTAKLSNSPLLILKGDWGTGKSHLLADITRKRIQENKITLFLIGNHFVNEENPWTQIFKNILRIDCSEDEFLGALNSRAEAQESRLLIIIDAINEGKGIYFWADHLKSFIRKINEFEFLGLVLSYRTCYENLLFPSSILDDKSINKITHYGFAHNEYEAIRLFFTNYKIEYLNTPLLHPEFSNPLFLKLFCEGISKARLNKIPRGFTGISLIISLFIDSINEELSSPKRLDYSKGINLVKKTIDIYIEQLIVKKQHYLAFEEAFTLFEQELRRVSIKNNLLDNLVSEGVFYKNIHYPSNGKEFEVIYLSYQRFEDHLSASFLLEKYLDKENIEKTFTEGSHLFKYIKNESECYKNKGLIESFSIQIPEITEYEFFELAHSCKSYIPVIDSFLESLIWRKPDTIKNKTQEYINKFVVIHKETYDKFLDILILITSCPEHLYNADFLHNHLNKFTLPERDAWWIPYTQENYLYGTSITRLIEWSRNNVEKTYISDDSRFLICKTLSWFLSSSNRYLRDVSTKAIISLLSNKIELVIKLLKDFENVNDPFILERLYAIAYGCTLRTSQTNFLYELSRYIFEAIFNQEEIYPNILLRDYARGVIEYTIHVGVEIDFNAKKTRPPYKSCFPTKFPTNDEIDKKYKINYNDQNFKKYYWSQNSILTSMTTLVGRDNAGYGDFGRYVFESALENWVNVNPNLLSNWAIQRVFELGYDVEKHGEFDINQGHGRSSAHNERIGKKYQWIAFYEILARVSDNFKLKNPVF